MDIRVSLETSAENHAGKLRVGGKTIRCFTRAQLKAFHPQGSYKILGEIRLPDERIQPYRRHKRLLYAEKGYWRCGQGVYVALIRRVWPTRLAFTAVLCAAVLGICFSWSALRTVLESFSACAGQAPFRSPPQIWIRTRRTMWGRSPTIKEIRRRLHPDSRLQEYYGGCQNGKAERRPDESRG